MSGLRFTFEVLLGKLLNLWSAGKRNALVSCEFVQHVSNPDVQGFTKDPVPPVQSSNDLRIAARYIQQDGVVTPALLATNFNVGDAMVDADQRNIHSRCQSTSDGRTDTKARSETGPLRIGHCSDVVRRQVVFFQHSLEQHGGHVFVVVSSLSRMNAALVRPERIARCRIRDAVVVHKAKREGVSRRFNSEGPSCHETPTNRLFFNPLPLLWYVRTIYLNAGRMVHFDTSRPMDEESTLAAGMAIVVEGNEIQSIHPSQDIIDEFGLGAQGTSAPIEGIHVHDLGGQAVVPGLVDGHTHLLWSGDRSQEVAWRQEGKTYAEIASMGGGIRSTVQSTRSATEDDLFTSGLRTFAKRIADGHHTHGSKKRLRIIDRF